MTFTEALYKAGKSFDDITKVYRGKDNYCRCGCGGNYYYKGEKGFTRAVNQMFKLNLESEFDEKWPDFINMPYDDSIREGKALTCYFD